MPEKHGAHRDPALPPNMGEHLDGFGNYVTVYGATNPTSLTGVSTGVEPLQLHDRMPGYGIVRLNKEERTITMENWPRYVDPGTPTTGRQYEGWPKTIDMEDNYGREAVAFLPTIEVEGIIDPVLQIIDEADGDIVYTLRIKGTNFRPKVFREGVYTVRVGHQESDLMKEMTGVESLPPDEQAVLLIYF